VIANVSVFGSQCEEARCHNPIRYRIAIGADSCTELPASEVAERSGKFRQPLGTSAWAGAAVLHNSNAPARQAAELNSKV